MAGRVRAAAAVARTQCHHSPVHSHAGEHFASRWQLQSAPHWQSGPQPQAVWPASAGEFEWAIIESWSLSVFMNFSSCWVRDGSDSIHHPRRAIEQNGYSSRTLAGAMPNIRRKVREKCAESAKPPV
jgi:hypothetical protein